MFPLMKKRETPNSVITAGQFTMARDLLPLRFSVLNSKMLKIASHKSILRSKEDNIMKYLISA